MRVLMSVMFFFYSLLMEYTLSVGELLALSRLLNVWSSCTHYLWYVWLLLLLGVERITGSSVVRLFYCSFDPVLWRVLDYCWERWNFFVSLWWSYAFRGGAGYRLYWRLFLAFVHFCRVMLAVV